MLNDPEENSYSDNEGEESDPSGWREKWSNRRISFLSSIVTNCYFDKNPPFFQMEKIPFKKFEVPEKKDVPSPIND